MGDGVSRLVAWLWRDPGHGRLAVTLAVMAASTAAGFLVHVRGPLGFPLGVLCGAGICFGGWRR